MMFPIACGSLIPSIEVVVFAAILWLGPILVSAIVLTTMLVRQQFRGPRLQANSADPVPADCGSRQSNSIFIATAGLVVSAIWTLVPSIALTILETIRLNDFALQANR